MASAVRLLILILFQWQVGGGSQSQEQKCEELDWIVWHSHAVFSGTIRRMDDHGRMTVDIKSFLKGGWSDASIVLDLSDPPWTPHSAGDPHCAGSITRMKMGDSRIFFARSDGARVVTVIPPIPVTAAILTRLRRMNICESI